MHRPHCVRSVLTTSVKILPYRPPARLIRANSLKYNRITPILKDLHWLLLTEPVKFKILILTYIFSLNILLSFYNILFSIGVLYMLSRDSLRTLCEHYGAG